MNATTVLNDLQYIIDKKSRYLQHCKDEQKECKALEIELATLMQTKELLENLVMQQQEATKKLEEAQTTIKSAEQAVLIAKAVEAEYHSAVYWRSPGKAACLMSLLVNPEIAVKEWEDTLKVQKGYYTVAEAVEQRWDYFNARNRETYEDWCKSARIDYRKREPIWREIWVNKKNSENHA